MRMDLFLILRPTRFIFFVIKLTFFNCFTQNDENIAKQETARKTDFEDEATPVEETNGKFVCF